MDIEDSFKNMLNNLTAQTLQEIERDQDWTLTRIKERVEEARKEIEKNSCSRSKQQSQGQDCGSI